MGPLGPHVGPYRGPIGDPTEAPIAAPIGAPIGPQVGPFYWGYSSSRQTFPMRLLVGLQWALIHTGAIKLKLLCRKTAAREAPGALCS